MINIGKKIQDERLKLGLSLRQTEELTGIDHSRIFRIENNSSKPDISELFAIARALGCEVCDLIPCGYSQSERQFIRSMRLISNTYIRHFSKYDC